VADHRPLGGDVVVSPCRDGPVRLDAFPPGHRGPAAREDHSLAASGVGGLEHVPGTGDVRLEELIPGEVFSRLGGEMDNDVLSLEGRANRLEIGEFRLGRRHTLHRSTIQRRERCVRLQPIPHQAADQATHPGNENVHGVNSLAGSAPRMGTRWTWSRDSGRVGQGVVPDALVDEILREVAARAATGTYAEFLGELVNVVDTRGNRLANLGVPDRVA